MKLPWGPSVMVPSALHLHGGQQIDVKEEAVPSRNGGCRFGAGNSCDKDQHIYRLVRGGDGQLQASAVAGVVLALATDVAVALAGPRAHTSALVRAACFPTPFPTLPPRPSAVPS